MRKITRDVCKAFIEGKKRSLNNTFTDGICLFLHYSLIARRYDDGSYAMTLADWPTVTTRERLNGLCQLLGLPERFTQYRNEQYFGSRKITPTEWINVPVTVPR